MDGESVQRAIKCFNAKYCSDLTKLKLEEERIKKLYEKKLLIARAMCEHTPSEHNSSVCIWCGTHLQVG